MEKLSDILLGVKGHDYRSFVMVLMFGGIAILLLSLYKNESYTPYGAAAGAVFVGIGLAIYIWGSREESAKLWTAYYPHDLTEETKGTVKKELERILGVAEKFVKQSGGCSDNLRANLFFPDPKKSAHERMLCLTIPPGLDIDLTDDERNFFFAPNEGVTGVCFSNKEAVATRAVYKNGAIDDWLHVATKVKYKSFYLSTKKSTKLAKIDWIIAVPLFYSENNNDYSLGVLNIDCLLPENGSAPLGNASIVSLAQSLFQESPQLSKIFQETKNSCGKLVLQRIN